MSDDLISREAAIALVYKLGYINVSNQYDFKANCRVDKIRQELVELPTAFDKEKVIEELNSERNLMYREDGTLMGARTQISIDRAVDIVEKGGIE